MLHMWSSFAGVAILSVVIIRLLIPFSHAVGLLDRPSERKAHKGTIPLVGGISIYLSVVMGAIVFLDLSQSYISIGIICGLITSLGALDDRYPLPASYRMALQLIAGGLALIAMLSLLYLTESRAPEHEVAIMMYLCIAIIIFLLFNLSLRPTIKIFMGDAGSTFLGCAVAIAMIHFSQSNRDIINPATTLWLTAVPVIDMISTVLRRLGKGKSPFHADRTHLHHLLMRGGQSQRRALISILLIATVLAFTGIFLERVWPQNEAVSFGLWLMMLGLYLKIITNQAPYFAKRFTKVK